MLGLRVAYTPGHASHHVCLPARGQRLGVRRRRRRRAHPARRPHRCTPTPPPDIDVEAWLDSIATVESWSPETIAVTHFGAHEDVAATLDDARTQLRRWAGVARELDEAGFSERFHADLAEHVDDEHVLAAITQASDPRLEYAGLARYWHKLGNDRHPA